MRVLVTGAAGFIGLELLHQLLTQGIANQDVSAVIALDLQAPKIECEPRLHVMRGDIADEAIWEEVLQSPIDVVFHLASLPGGAAQANPVLGRQVNLDATVHLLEALQRQAHTDPREVRVIYASTVAVYGDALAEVVDDQTPCSPVLSYGTHKLMGEMLLADAVRRSCGDRAADRARGSITGCSLRLPGVVARPGEGLGLMSAYMSQLFWCAKSARALTVPVSAHGQSWWLSVRQCVHNLRLAAALSAQTLQILGPRAVAQMPALRLCVHDLLEALSDYLGRDCHSLVHYEVQEQVDRLFARYPRLQSPLAQALGLKHDGDARSLVSSVLGSADNL